MRAGIYNPYLDTFGGGERYTFAFAHYLSQRYSVDILLDHRLSQLDEAELRSNIEERLKFNLVDIHFVNVELASDEGFHRASRQYDVFLLVMGDRVPLCAAEHGLLLIQMPNMVRDLDGANAREHLHSWKHVICYSAFVKRYIDVEWGISAIVIPPCVDLDLLKPLNKLNYIVSVGRFFVTGHSKKQHVLVDAFRRMCDSGVSDWELYLIGGVRGEDGYQYVEQVQEQARRYPVRIMLNVPATVLLEIYGQSKIYWHATGFGEDSNEHPERMEHFGIAPLEAMACGTVPIVYGHGGLREIVEDGCSGFLWESLDELIRKTRLLMDERMLSSFKARAIERSKHFGFEAFSQRVSTLLST